MSRTGGPSIYCKFEGCGNNSRNNNSVRFYRFPKDENRCQAWVLACQNKKLCGIPAVKLYASARVCSEHFQDWCFMNNVSKHRLVHNAVPNSPKPGPSSSDTLSSSLVGESVSNVPLEIDITSTATDPVPDTNYPVQSDKFDDSRLRQLLLSPISNTNIVSSSNDTRFCDVSSIVWSRSGENTSNSLLMPASPVPSPVITCSTPVSHLSRKYTPRKTKLAQQLKKQRDLNRRITMKYKAKKMQLEKIRSLPLKTRLVNEGVDDKLATFIHRQVKLSLEKSKRYTTSDKIYAYQIFSKSRAAYRALRDVLKFPSERTLRRFISSKLCNAGLDADVIGALKKVLEKTDKPKFYALIFDEMSIKPCLVYDKKKDLVIGFEDLGCNSRNNSIANQALVLMVRDLSSKKKLPIGFFFSRHAMSADYLKAIILGALTALDEAGAIVKVLVCDQGTNNSSFFSKLGIKPSTPYFNFNGRKIYGMYDPPHLLKNLRRSLMKYDLETNQGTISFDYIKQFYLLDQRNPVQCAPKLTDKHIFTEGMNLMKVSLAAQVFSNSVAAGMYMCVSGKLLDSKALITAKFVEQINNLFDSVNGTRSKLFGKKIYHCAVSNNSKHLDFWQEMLTFIQSWKFVEKKNNTDVLRINEDQLPCQETGTNVDHLPCQQQETSESQLPCQELSTSEKPKFAPKPRSKAGWTLTLNSFLSLSKEMLVHLKYFMTKRCNQDCLENFFSRIRGSGGNRTDPSAYEFASAYRLASVNIFSSKSKSTNCEQDEDKFMFVLLNSNYEKTNNELHKTEDIVDDNGSNGELIVDTADPDEVFFESASFKMLDFIAQNIITFAAGYVSRRVLRVLHLNCNVCENLLVDKNKPWLSHTLYLHFKEYDQTNLDEGGLTHPTENLVNCMALFFETAETYFNESLHSMNILGTLEQMFTSSCALNFILCSSHAAEVKQKIVFFASRFFLRVHLREKNKAINVTSSSLKKIQKRKMI